MSRARRGEDSDRGQMRRALTFYTLGKPRLWREVNRARSLSGAGAVPHVKGDLPFAWFVPGAVAPSMARGRPAAVSKTNVKEVLWSAIAFGYV